MMKDKEITMLVNSLVDRDEWEAVECIRELQLRLESLEKDAARLDHIQNNGATVSMIFVNDGFAFSVGGIHGAHSIDVRCAIDAAMQANKGE